MQEIDFEPIVGIREGHYNIYSVPFNGGEELSDYDIYLQAAEMFPQLQDRKYAMGEMVVYSRDVRREPEGNLLEVVMAWYD
jgi:hypothetical protein